MSFEKKLGFYLKNCPVRAIFVLRVENHGLSAIWTFSTNLCQLTLKRSNFVLFWARGLILFANGQLSMTFLTCNYKHLTLDSKIEKHIDKTQIIHVSCKIAAQFEVLFLTPLLWEFEFLPAEESSLKIIFPYENTLKF